MIVRRPLVIARSAAVPAARIPILLLAAVLLAAPLQGCGSAATSTAASAPASSAAPSVSVPGASVTTSPASQSASPTGDLLASVLARLRDATLAPGALAVVVDGATRTAAASGVRSVGGAAIDPGDRFRIGSITKPVVAALVLISVDRGELGLDDVVSERLPGVLRPQPAVTVRQLLAHTSGVFDEGNEGDVVADTARLADPALRHEAEGLFARYAKGERVVAPDRLLVALAETHERYFAPGAGYHYSNINYQVLGMLLQKVTGKTLGQLLQSRIVAPLGLKATTLAPEDRASPDVRGYDSATTGTKVDITDDLALFGNGGNGGVVTTADELLAILRAIVTAKLFAPALVAEMERPVRESYGLGLGTMTYGCGTFYGHGGSVSGTQSIAGVSPDGARGVVAAVNIVSGSDPGLSRVAGTLLCGE